MTSQCSLPYARDCPVHQLRSWESIVSMTRVCAGRGSIPGRCNLSLSICNVYTPSVKPPHSWSVGTVDAFPDVITVHSPSSGLEVRVSEYKPPIPPKSPRRALGVSNVSAEFDWQYCIQYIGKCLLFCVINMSGVCLERSGN
jgi:hypothetical protein